MLRKKNIFLIEDNENDINLIMNILHELNLSSNVKLFRNGQEALDYFFNIKNEADFIYPTIVLLDIKLPKINGIQFLKKLRKDEKYKFLPVVILTSSGHENDIKDCYQLGANGYVVKPVNFEDFFSVLKTTLSYWVNINEPPVYS